MVPKCAYRCFANGKGTIVGHQETDDFIGGGGAESKWFWSICRRRGKAVTCRKQRVVKLNYQNMVHTPRVTRFVISPPQCIPPSG